MPSLMPTGKQQYFYPGTPLPLVGGKLYTYAAGTNTPKPTYQDAAGATPNTNPVTLDSTGSALIFWSGSYKVVLKDALGNTIYTVDNYVTDLAAILQQSLLSPAGASEIGFSPAGAVAVPTTVEAVLRQTVTVDQFILAVENDHTAAFQRAVDYLQTLSTGYSSGFFTVKMPRASYSLLGTVDVNLNANVMQLAFESDSGTVINGGGANVGFNFNNGGYRNIFSKINFNNFGTAIRWTTNNRNECHLRIADCAAGTNDIFLDTVNYASSRSSMVDISDCLIVSTRVVVKHYTDQMTIRNCWLYAKDGSSDALLYLSGDGNVHIKDTFLIPNANQIPAPVNSRWIDFVSDPAQGTPGDRSLKTLKLSGVRQSLESARPLIWTIDTCPTLPNGNNQVSSITIEDSACPGTGGYALVRYKQGYPGSVSLRNVKVFASALCDVDPANTAPPAPSVPGALTQHVIMVDEATRLSQNNGNNSRLIIDPKLEGFVYDTTTQTSKYKTSIQKNIDYRLRAVNAPAAGANKVKTTLPIFFDSAPAVANRDILSFLLVTVGDAGANLYNAPAYRAIAVTLVTIVGGDSGGAKKRITATVMQDAKGGLTNFTDSTAAPTVFWGQGDTGAADISASSATGTEDFITAVWSSSSPDTSWAYIVPLAGIRANQWDKMQFNVW